MFWIEYLHLHFPYIHVVEGMITTTTTATTTLCTYSNPMYEQLYNHRYHGKEQIIGLKTPGTW